MSTGVQEPGTSIFRSNNLCTSRHIFRIHLYDGKIYTPALCDNPTLFVYDISLDQISSIYQPSTSNVVFRNVYFKNSRIYFTGHQIISGNMNAWIGSASPNSITTLLDISNTTSFPVNVDTVVSHVPTIQSSTNHSLYVISMASYSPQSSLTGNLVIKSYISKFLFFHSLKSWLLFSFLCRLFRR